MCDRGTAVTIHLEDLRIGEITGYSVKVRQRVVDATPMPTSPETAVACAKCAIMAYSADPFSNLRQTSEGECA